MKTKDFFYMIFSSSTSFMASSCIGIAVGFGVAVSSIEVHDTFLDAPYEYKYWSSYESPPLTKSGDVLLVRTMETEYQRVKSKVSALEIAASRCSDRYDISMNSYNCQAISSNLRKARKELSLQPMWLRELDNNSEEVFVTLGFAIGLLSFLMSFKLMYRKLKKTTGFKTGNDV